MATDLRRILFATDLHGYPERFERVFEAAVEHGVQAVVCGGDNFTYFHHATPDEAFAAQRRLFAGFLDPHFARYDRAGIHWLGILSVHDIDGLDGEFAAIADRHPCVHPIDGVCFPLGNYDFLGLGLVVDHPFWPKVRCRRDTAAAVMGPQFMPPLRSTPFGWEPIPDWEAELARLPALEAELEALPRPRDPDRAVYVLHHPPAGCGLDVVILDAVAKPLTGDLSTRPRMEIGSVAIRDFLTRVQPLLALHGHVHESPLASGVWRADLGRTLCIQPGQHETGGKTHFVVIDLHTREAHRFLE